MSDETQVTDATASEAVATPETSEPDYGSVVVGQGGQRMVPVSVLAAERARVRESAEAKVRAEYEPFKAEAATAKQLKADLEALRPQLAYLNEHPELFQPQPDTTNSDVADDEAEKYARRMELYTATGLDTRRAKAIISENRSEMQRVAMEAAQAVVHPAMQQQQQARANFAWAAGQRDPQGNPLVDPQFLATEWAKLPADLTSRPEVAQHILQAAIGAYHMSGKRPSAAPHSEPLYSEPAGGGRPQAYQISDVERRIAKTAGISEKDWAGTAKNYRPDMMNVLGE